MQTLSPTPDLLSQKLLEWEGVIWVLMSSLGDSHALKFENDGLRPITYCLGLGSLLPEQS